MRKFFIVKTVRRRDRVSSPRGYITPFHLVSVSDRLESLVRAMWRLVPALTLVSVTLVAALPAAQQDSGSLASLIDQAFPEARTTTTPQPVPQIDGDLDSLIQDVFKSTNVTTTTAKNLILGSQNTPPPKPDNCECVPYYQCKEGKILENGVGIIDIRFGADNNTGSERWVYWPKIEISAGFSLPADGLWHAVKFLRVQQNLPINDTVSL